MTTLTYLASPYSHKDPHIQYMRFVQVSKAAAYLTQLNWHLVAPISMSVPIAEYGNLQDTNFNSWKKLDLELITRCDDMIVLMLDGWKESIGVQAEIKYATELKKDIHFIEPRTVVSSDSIPRFDRFHPVFSKALDRIEEVFAMGAKKHGDLNFLEANGNKCDHKSMHDSLFHHLAHSYSDILYDPESKLMPMDHVACRAIIAIARHNLGLVHPIDTGDNK